MEDDGDGDDDAGEPSGDADVKISKGKIIDEEGNEVGLTTAKVEGQVTHRANQIRSEIRKKNPGSPDKGRFVDANGKPIARKK